ncbi:putative salicylate hydroxylase [Viridothelium virens]|uniref:Putative salicylate hydroxylase n=1 Tax=Viridothelium virens TaxID=1048519 RepID=A0A6A6GTL7_VIRVR|nr:putative salicylate hydroxylase [Viridothelium virens]
MGSVPNETKDISPHDTAYSVAVVGGGIGGLCLAIGLMKHKHIDVQIYEAAPSFGEIGAGISIGPNAQRALELIAPGAAQAFKDRATPNLWTSHANTFSHFWSCYGDASGQLIAEQRNRSGMQSVHRARFLDGLVTLIPPQRAHFGKRLIKLEHNETEEVGCVMHFKDGTSASADAVIGADGIHSAVRKYLLGENHPATNPQFTGTAAYRGIVSMDAAVERLGPEFAQNAVVLCGPGAAIMGYPIEHGELLNIVVMDFEAGDTWPHEKWIVPADYKFLQEKIKGWWDPAQGMIELINTPDLATWGMFDSPPAPYYNKGPVAIMGDAAHATTPYQGQGAAQAVEDALVLETLFGNCKTADQIPIALTAYNQVRLPRSQRTVTTSRESGQLLGMKLPGVGSDVKKMKSKFETRMHWLWNRDLVSQSLAAVRLFEEAL